MLMLYSPVPSPALGACSMLVFMQLAFNYSFVMFLIREAYPQVWA